MIRIGHIALLSTLCFSCISLPSQAQTVEERITAAATSQRLQLAFDGQSFSGPAWDKLVEAGRDAQFFLLGEEHGIAENPKFAGQLFATLSTHGYTKMAIETSPTMASKLDAALSDNGLVGLVDLYSQPGGEPAFFGMQEEAEMLALVREHAPQNTPVLWGTDYEVLSDRQLISELQLADKPQAANTALTALADASLEAWESHAQTGSPEFMFSFSGNPALVTSIKDAWPQPDPTSAVILNTLEKTLRVNQLWTSGNRWESNLLRASLQRENFLRYWRDAKAQGETPKVFAKYGASHMIRGRSQTSVYDLGTLLPEIAVIEGGHSFSLLVVPDTESQVAVFNPSTFGFEPRPAKDGYNEGIEPLLDAAFADEFTLIDLAALRPIAGMSRGTLTEELFGIIHGFDMILIMSGANPSTELEH